MEGLRELKDVIRKLHANGVSIYKMAKLLSIPNPRLSQLLKDESSLPTASNLSFVSEFGYKALVVFIPEDDENTYRQLQDINKKSLDDLYERIFKAASEMKTKREAKKENKDTKVNEEFSEANNIFKPQESFIEEKVAKTDDEDDKYLL